MPSNPVNVSELILPNEYQQYVPQPGITENFLLADTGASQNRILIFGRKSWIKHLETAEVWYADGTFSISPPLFSQVYIVMVEKHGGVHPILYILLPNKTRETYNALFTLIKNIAPSANPKSINCDFEIAAIAAMKDAFPAVTINGCFFHLSQNMHKHLGQMGLISFYRNDPEFALEAKMIIALAFVPLENLDDATDLLANNLRQELLPLLEWFEDNYLGRINR